MIAVEKSAPLAGYPRPTDSGHLVQAAIHQGHGWVVDLDLEAFFDRVNHDRRMARLKHAVMTVT